MMGGLARFPAAPGAYRQAGSALILAMLVASLVAMLAVQFSEAFVRKGAVAEARLLQQRFETYLQGAEALVAQLLMLDLQQDQEAAQQGRDHLQETWATTLPPLPTDDGWLEVSIEDAQGRFNLNNLAVKTAYFDDVGVPARLRFSAPQRQFIRLLQSLPDVGVTETQATAITEAIVDWIDEDDQVSGMAGAESLFYTNSSNTSASAPLQAANQTLHDVSELALVRHLTPQILAALRSRVTVLPTATALNINTAPATVLLAINSEDALEPAQRVVIDSLLSQRGQRPFASVDEFLQFGMAVEDSQEEAGAAPLYSVSSEYFIAHIRVGIDGVTRHMRTLLHRDERGISTLARYHNIFDDQPFANR